MDLNTNKLKLKLACCFYILMFVCACNSEKSQKQEVIEPLFETAKTEEPVRMTPSDDMNVYQNMEIVEYCALIPKDYEEGDSGEKAGHSFVHKTKQNNTIEIKGLLRANTEVKIEKYFAGSLEDAELEGKIIEKKELITADNCFYAKGYWNNSIHESRFIEVCWLRSDEVVKYYSFFDVADTTIWNNRLNEILSAGSNCK